MPRAGSEPPARKATKGKMAPKERSSPPVRSNPVDTGSETSTSMWRHRRPAGTETLVPNSFGVERSLQRSRRRRPNRPPRRTRRKSGRCRRNVPSRSIALPRRRHRRVVTVHLPLGTGASAPRRLRCRRAVAASSSFAFHSEPAHRRRDAFAVDGSCSAPEVDAVSADSAPIDFGTTALLRAVAVPGDLPASPVLLS
ncbi:UNVERIFIED_CONTAM: hypothetical protein K2H54_066897 [Gekko kuhli]